MDLMLPLFEGAVETGKIKRKSFKNWIVSSYKISFALADKFPVTNSFHFLIFLLFCVSSDVLQ